MSGCGRFFPPWRRALWMIIGGIFHNSAACTSAQCQQTCPPFIKIEDNSSTQAIGVRLYLLIFSGLFKISISLILMKRSSSLAKNKITWPRRSSSQAMTRSILRSRSRSLISHFLRVLFIIFWNLGTFLDSFMCPCQKQVIIETF